MSGIEALGTVASIFQVISFGRETISLCKAVYRNGNSVDQTLVDNARILDQLSSQVHRVATASISGRLPSTDEKQLSEILKKCQAASRDLQEEVNFITTHAKEGSLASTLKIVAKVNWRKRRLDTLERKLGEAQKLVEAGLLVRICNRVDLAQPKFDALDADVRYFIANYQAGERTVSGLISTEALKTRSQISSAVSGLESTLNLNTDEVRKLSTSIKQHVKETIVATTTLKKDLSDIDLAQKRQKQRECLLKSLKFPGMNERRQQVAESFPETFQWIYKEGIAFDEDDRARGDASDDDGVNEDSRAQSRRLEKKDVRSLKRRGIVSNLSYHDASWDSFGDWLRSDSLLYWISGKPGAGKTTLVKYLITNERTKSALNIWKSEIIIVSHFFWRPGSPMQQNIMGFLCSLLYQLVEANDQLIEHISTHFEDFTRKDTYTDWAVPELRQLCFQSLQNFRRPLCIFMDGLDEVDPRDGISELFEVVNMIKLSPSTKICLSSRPEPRIAKRLERYPKLRVQDLTLGDLWTYAEGKLHFPSLPPYCVKYKHEEDCRDLLRSLVYKSEGVFLWLCLAVKSINTGFDNADDLQEAMLRVGQLPPDIVGLYMDMWTRLNDESSIYRSHAALYLKLMLACQHSPGVESDVPMWRCLAHPNITILEMAVATASPEIQLEPANATAETLLHHCRETIRLVQTRCAGLLEVVVLPKYRYHPNAGLTTVFPFADRSQTIRIIHRTAFDFLRDTEEGKTILSADSSSKQSLHLKLYGACLFVRCLLPDYLMLERFGLRGLAYDLSRIWCLVRSNPNPASNAKLQECVKLLESLAYSRLWDTRHKSRYLHEDEFLVYAASADLSIYVTGALATRKIDDKIKSDILLALACKVGNDLEPSQDDIKLLEILLEQGVDVNYKGDVLGSGNGTSLATATPICDFAGRLIQSDLQKATYMAIRRKLHVMDNLLEYGACTSNLVLVNLKFQCHGTNRLVLFNYVGDEGWYGDYIEPGRNAGQNVFGSWILLVPASILINMFMKQVEELICKMGHSVEGCCSNDHITSIRNKAKSFDAAAKPHIVALSDDRGSFWVVCQEDSNYLSDRVPNFSSHLKWNGSEAMLKSLVLEVRERSEKRTDIVNFLEEKGVGVGLFKTWPWIS